MQFYNDRDDLIADLELVTGLYLEDADKDGYFAQYEMNVSRPSNKYGTSTKKEDIEVYINFEEVDQIIDSFRKIKTNGECCIYTNTWMEALVNIDATPFRHGSRRLKDIISYNFENALESKGRGIKIGIKKPSPTMLSYILYVSKQKNWLKKQRHPPTKIKVNNNSDTINAFQFLNEYPITQLYSIRIESENSTSLPHWDDLSHGFLFELAYNLNFSVTRQKHLTNPFVRKYLWEINKTSYKQMEIPRMTYNEDLVRHYQTGIMSDNIASKYLSFYHILEHYFSSIFMDNLTQKVQQRIVKPDFSHTNKSNIQDLIKYISRNVSTLKSELIFTESEALKLLLIRDVDLQQLLKKINTYDSELINYYKDKKVIFSNGKTVDLNQHNNPATYSSLTDRIYQTRNAIVHSKEDSKNRYLPFEHEHSLHKEMTLIKAIAELVIIKNGRIIV